MKIVIDAGHSLYTAGKCVPDGSMKEWEFNSQVARVIEDELKYYSGVEVMRTDDPSGEVDVPLSERTEKANEWGADVFISIHANAFGTGGFNSAHGVETYIHTSRPDEAEALGAHIQTRLVRATNRANRGLKTANFQVLRDTKMTAVLVECGFMTNREEAELLKSYSYRVNCANAIIEALKDKYGIKPKAKPRGSKLYRVQMGAFGVKENAEALAERLKAAGFDAIVKGD